MAYEVITLNLIPSGEVPVIHAAQFDVNRPLMFALKLGDDDFDPSTYDLELQIRKVDNNIVTAAPASISGNVVTFNSTEQMTACSGTNLGEIQITKDDLDIATLHFYLVVQRDVLAGGVTSESDIYNLTEQIAEIVPEVIGEDYYNKEEVDELIADIPTFDPTNYYDKSETDELLGEKANTSSLSAVAFSGDYNDLENKPTIPDISNYYTKTEVDNKITDLYQVKTALGSIVHITDGGNNIPLKSFESDIVAVETGSGPKSPSNPYIISGFSSGIVSVNSNTYTFTFGQTVYGGHFDNKGNLVNNRGELVLSSLNWYYSSNGYFESSINIDCPTRTQWNAQNGNCGIYTIVGMRYVTNAADRINNSIAWYSNVIRIADNSTTDVATFITNLQNQSVYYELATPITIAITDQKILTEKVCDISSDTGDIEIEYFTENSDGIAELIKAFM